MCSPMNIKTKISVQLQPADAMDKQRAASEQRKVHFDQVVHCRRFRKYSCTEEDNVWFSRQEQEQAAREIRETIKMMHQGIRLDKSKFTSRGLERLDHAEQLLKHRRRVVASVIEEQYRQWEEDGMLDDDQISAVYREQTQGSEIEAQALAARDHRDVELMILEDANVNIKVNPISWMKKRHQQRPKRRSPTAKPLNFGSLAA